MRTISDYHTSAGNQHALILGGSFDATAVNLQLVILLLVSMSISSKKDYLISIKFSLTEIPV